MHYHWSGQLHYVSPANDHPPVVCAWTGEVKTDQNVLQAVLNYTSRVQQYRQDEDLRFLVQCAFRGFLVSWLCPRTLTRVRCGAAAAMWATCISRCT